MSHSVSSLSLFRRIIALKHSVRPSSAVGFAHSTAQKGFWLRCFVSSLGAFFLRWMQKVAFRWTRTAICCRKDCTKELLVHKSKARPPESPPFRSTTQMRTLEKNVGLFRSFSSLNTRNIKARNKKPCSIQSRKATRFPATYGLHSSVLLKTSRGFNPGHLVAEKYQRTKLLKKNIELSNPFAWAYGV